MFGLLELTKLIIVDCLYVAVQASYRQVLDGRQKIDFGHVTM